MIYRHASLIQLVICYSISDMYNSIITIFRYTQLEIFLNVFRDVSRIVYI